ncbi:hypothetical protein E1A91_D10G068600v1 [Gossypium mustelinum]|uniref:Uncharacterized protein n=2 Tax=Gossypium TaxID=3633 RepID=A0A5J5PRC8_GOSBA|nr:hypothetical protein ES319_D10G064900v1 [Gossypium barbadense]TYI59910.1 hypothetical protein E1A91_D10G068600v1 [Gossypium mustelinum]
MPTVEPPRTVLEARSMLGGARAWRGLVSCCGARGKAGGAAAKGFQKP